MNNSQTTRLDGSMPTDETGGIEAVGGGSLVGRVLGERYKLLRFVDYGGTSDVYLAEHVSLGESVAVKVLRNTGTTDEVTRFRDEAKALWRIRHQNIIKILDFGVDGENTYMVAEYLQGKTLQEILKKHAVPPRRFVMKVMDQLLVALETSHREGVVHRDVAPGNIFCVDFHSIKNPPFVRLIDFGLASMHRRGEIWGTPGYMSPEQARGEGAYFSSDIFSAGVVLYELLTGVLPYNADTLEDMLWRYENTVPSPPHEVAGKAAVPLALSDIVMKAIARDPEKRYRSAEMFRDALVEVLSETYADETQRYFTSEETEGEEYPSEPLEQKEINQLLRRVRKFWVDGYLLRNTGTFATLPQPKTLSDELVDTPWKTVGCSAPFNESLDPRQPLLDIFERMQQRLLILGDSGHGKTVSLLKLLRSACDKAENRSASVQPIPVLFTLSSWRESKGTLFEWMVDELAVKYAVPRRLGRMWIENRYILPFFDGLNEVQSGDVAACIRAINGFNDEYTPKGLVVTCRKQDYVDSGMKLRLNGCITLGSLELESIRRILRFDRWKTLQSAIDEAPELETMIRVPLMLQIAGEIVEGSGEVFDASGAPASSEIAEAIFKRYIELNFKRKRDEQHVDVDDRRKQKILHQLAGAMLHTGETVFLFETMQPKWIRGFAMRLVYAMVSRLVVALLFGVSIIVPMGLTPVDNAGLVTDLRFGAHLGLIGAAVLGIGYGIWAALDIRRIDFTSYRPRKESLMKLFLFNLVLGFILGGILYAVYRHPFVFFLSTETALVGGVLLGLTRRRQHILLGDIVPVETISWHVEGLKGRRFFLVMVGGLAGSCIYAVYTDLAVALYLFFPVLAVGTIMLSLKKDFRSWKPIPNMGIYQSLRNALFTGGLSFAVTTLSFGYSYGLLYGAYVGMTISVMVALWFGGIEVINHFILRIVLAAEGTFDFFVKKSLRDACEMSILRQVGGGFMFEHETFMKYFAGVHYVISK